ncbi:hypothetical protein [Shinella zoogloeoides]|uniref:hypothetical protein n=1 Tax=Shinella zoogloeoides TaxID=352475 RepID=UPI00299D2EBC|nr:hypothetical protein [Shinella zoogloeoides]WPE22443.1 hypothetical protein ShzoTeo12_36590 [Shinella zoogloeoides]
MSMTKKIEDGGLYCIIEALELCHDYLSNRSDADCDQDGFQPNKEMVLLSKVQSALEHFSTTKPVTFQSADDLLNAASGMKRIVEELDGAIKHGTWRDEHGLRLKDTPEWIVFYNALSKAAAVRKTGGGE